jgi:hypothetical protein
MPNRVNHVKLIASHPELINAFLTQVCDIPEGWPLGPAGDPVSLDTPLGDGVNLPHSAVDERRVTAEGRFGGYIAGDSSSRQFQILAGQHSAFWAICISTRDIEGVFEKCQARGVPCTPITVADWNERDNIVNFFCIVDDLMFEIIRVERKQPAS